MRYCKRCLYGDNHPLGLVIDNDGVCSGCRVHEERDTLEWEAREAALGRLFDTYRSKTKVNYDCIIPVSGGRDSYFIVDTVKNKFGMNPLLVTYNKHYNSRIGIQNLSYLRTLFDCDIFTLTLDPRALKRLTRASIEHCGSIYWHCLAGQTVLPVRIAAGYKIPLIVWGMHQGCDQVGMYSHLDEVEMTRRYRHEHDLMGFEAEDFIGKEGLTTRDMQPFMYPHDKEIEIIGIRGIYLGNYIRWDSKAQHEKMIARFGYQTAKLQRTFDTYNDVDCLHYTGLHDYIKYLKFGYGKVVDHAVREIRLKRLTRKEGLKLSAQFLKDEVPTDTELFLEWLGMTESELFRTLDAHRDSAAWKQLPDQTWQLRSSVLESVGDESVELEKTSDCRFQSDYDLSVMSERQLLTQGFVDERQRPSLKELS